MPLLDTVAVQDLPETVQLPSGWISLRFHLVRVATGSPALWVRGRLARVSSYPNSGTNQERLKDKRRREEREFWRRMSQVIPERNYRIWNAFEKGLEKYIVLLQVWVPGLCVVGWLRVRSESCNVQAVL